MEPNLLQIFGNYTSWKLTENTWVISFMEGSEYMYLLEGEKKALLLDTGYGTNTLHDHVHRLTDKPLVVANTHFHPDHAAGNGEFEAVYMSRGEILDRPSIDPHGPFDLSALPHPDYEKRYLGDGDVIELGGRTIEVLEALPAHCNSSLFFFDRASGMFFTGDELESTQVLMYDNSKNPDAPYDAAKRLANLRKNTERIKTYASQIRYLLPNHNGTPIALSYIDDMIGLVDHIYLGDAVIEDKLNHRYIEMDPVAPQLCRVRYKNISIFIKKKDLMEVYGSKA